MRTLATYSGDELDALIANHERQGALDAPRYRDALKERSRRNSAALSVEKTMNLIRERARRRQYVSYGEVAEASGVDWKKAHRRMPLHLRDVCKLAGHHGWPLVTAIVVNRTQMKTGELEAEALSGFVQCARDLNHTVVGDVSFLREQQEATFTWASAP